MKKEVWVYGLCFIITVVALVYAFSRNPKIIIKHPKIQTSEIIINKTYTILELPKHFIDVIKIYIDKNNNEHQVYSDWLVIDTDSLDLSIKSTIDINTETEQGFWSYDSLTIKNYETIKTIVITDTLKTTKLVYPDWYRNNWFWYFWIETLTILSVLILSITT